jgi:hypothetical protein
LTTGGATLVGSIGGGVPLNGLTAAVPEPGTLSLAFLGLGLFAFASRGLAPSLSLER